MNSLGGRSFKDLMQYPVFPWIFKDFSSKKIEIYSDQYYRDLTKSMGIFNFSN